MLFRKELKEEGCFTAVAGILNAISQCGANLWQMNALTLIANL
jgi:hypothetical protein